jgi:hypothetical protein
LSYPHGGGYTNPWAQNILLYGIWCPAGDTFIILVTEAFHVAFAHMLYSVNDLLFGNY